MDFASNYAYVSTQDEEEEVEEDELSIPLSSAVEMPRSQPLQALAPQPPQPQLQQQQPMQQQQPQPMQQEQARQQAENGPAVMSSLQDFLSQARNRLFGAPAPQAVPMAAPMAPPLGFAPQSAPGAMHHHPKRVVRVQADTNVVAIKLGDLAKDAEDLFAGDPIFCQGCRTALSKTSVVVKKNAAPASADAAAPAPLPTVPESVSMDANALQLAESKDNEHDNNEMLWVCEFCSFANTINIAPEELPTTDSRDYVIAPAAAASDVKQAEAGTVIFCIDTSGSMCVTKEVVGHLKLKGNRQNLQAFGNLHDAVVPRGRQSTTWVSRLQCVQAAVDHQLQAWKKSDGEKRVGLVTFNNEVTIFGDGSSAAEIVTGDKLQDQSQLQEIGARHRVGRPVAQSADVLSSRLFGLEENGATALGPALLVSVAMASHQPGSRVVICTDGLANVGLGALDSKNADQRAAAEQWYEGVANLAKLSGVSVSVVSIKGDECALEDLARVAEITGGQVDRVDPTELTKNFASILENPVIATNVSVTFFLHQGLKFRNEEEQASRLVRELGNVSKDTEITFEYTVRSREDVQRWAQNLKALPFQVQVSYTKLDGMRCLRIISKAQAITSDRQQAEQHARVDLLAANVAQQSAKMAESGDIRGARFANRAHGRVLERVSRANVAERNVYQNWVSESDGFDASLQQQQQAMPDISGSMPHESASSRKRAAKAHRSDEQYNAIHQFKGKSSSAWRR